MTSAERAVTIPYVTQDASEALRHLAAKTGAAARFALDRFEFGHRIEFDFSNPVGPFRVWMVPTNQTDRCFVATAHFKLGYSGSAPNDDAFELLRRLAEAVSRWENDYPPETLRMASNSPAPTTRVPEVPGFPFLEWFALRRGIKPVVRSAVRAVAVDGLREAALRHSLRIEFHDADAFIGGFVTGAQDRRVIAYAARDPEVLARASRAELAMIASTERGQQPTSDQVAELGRALGYPDCCIASFNYVRDLPNARIRFTALQRSPARCSHLLNDLLSDRSIASHFVCSYACSDSIRYAQAVLDALAKEDPKGAADLTAKQVGLVVVSRHGSVLRAIPTSNGPHIETCLDDSDPLDLAAWIPTIEAAVLPDSNSSHPTTRVERTTRLSQQLESTDVVLRTFA